MLWATRYVGMFKWRVSIYITLWSVQRYVHVPRYVQSVQRYVHVPRSVQSVQRYIAKSHNLLNIPEQTEHTKTDWTYLGTCTYWTYQNRLYNSMNVVRAGTLGKMTGTYCTYPNLVSSPPKWLILFLLLLLLPRYAIKLANSLFQKLVNSCFQNLDKPFLSQN